MLGEIIQAQKDGCCLTPPREVPGGVASRHRKQWGPGAGPWQEGSECAVGTEGPCSGDGGSVREDEQVLGMAVGKAQPGECSGAPSCTPRSSVLGVLYQNKINIFKRKFI